MSATGGLRPQGTYTGTTEGFYYVSANTRGALLVGAAVVGTTALSGIYYERPAELMTSEDLTVTAGSTDWAEFTGGLVVEYMSLAP